ncbi:hypothetical protein KQI52_12725 [bacterium]|nr:hypothetical protein [bacterium]
MKLPVRFSRPVLLLCSLLFVLTSTVFAIDPPQIRWYRTYGREFKEDARMLVSDQAGGYVAAGMSSTADTTAANMFLVHVDAVGEVIWQQFYDYGEQTKAKDVKRFRGDGYLVTGYRLNNDGTGMDGLILRLNNQGELIWDHILEGDRDDVAWRSFRVDDGYITVGITESTPGEQKDAFVMRLSEDGERLWLETFGTERVERATSAVLLPDEGLVLAGLSRDNPTANDDGWMMRIDADGNIVWWHQYGGDQADEFHWVEQTEDGGFILCGRSKSYRPPTEDYNTWLVKTDADGNEEWNNVYGPAQAADWAQMVQIIPDGYIMTGSAHTPERGNQITLVRVNEEGELVYFDARGFEGYDIGYAIRVTPDGGYIIAGKMLMEGQEFNDLIIGRTRPDVTLPRNKNIIK